MTLDKAIDRVEKGHRRVCRHKRKFLDEAEAMQIWSDDVGVKGDWQKRASETNLYVCRCCGYIHLGHKPDNRFRAALRTIAMAAAAGC